MSRLKKPLLVYNGSAGGGKAKKRIDKVYKQIIELGLFDSIDLFSSESVEETKKKISQVHTDGENDLLISFGGDGTISSIVNAMMDLPVASRLPVLPLPGGSGNSLLRDFKLTSFEGVLQRYREGHTSQFDLLKVTWPGQEAPYYCINMIGLGFISDVADYVTRKGKKYGQLSYLFGILLCLGNFHAYSVKITDGDDTILLDSDSVYFMTVSNTKFAGGAIKVAPEASFNDGKMDIIILHDIDRLQFLNGFRKTFSGKHIGQKGCKYIQASSIQITADPVLRLMPDGELFGKSPVSIDVIPGQIKMVL